MSEKKDANASFFICRLQPCTLGQQRLQKIRALWRRQGGKPARNIQMHLKILCLVIWAPVGLARRSRLPIFGKGAPERHHGLA